MILIILNLSRFFDWLSIWFILENVPCELEANKSLTLIFILVVLSWREREEADLRWRTFYRQLQLRAA